MEPQSTSFSKKIFSNTTFAIFDQISYKIGTTVGFILLVRLLTSTDIAAVGIASGYMILIGYLDNGLVRVLLRDYPQIADDAGERNLHFTAYMVFMLLQAVVMLLVAGVLNALVLSGLALPGLAFLYLALTVEFIALMFQDWIKLVFFTKLEQVFATKISVAVLIARLASYGILLFSPTLDTFSWLLIVVSAGTILIWGTVFTVKFAFRPVFSRRIIGVLKHALGSYGIWDHFNRMVADTLLNIDPAILTFFATLAAIGNYSIAIKVASLLLLLPRQLVRSLQVVLSNYQTDRERLNAIYTFTKANILLSVGQLAFFFLFGRLLIRALFGAVDVDAIYGYSLVLSTAVTIFSLAHPLIAISNTFASMRRLFLTVFLPSLAAGLAAYVAGAWLWGAYGMAMANVVVFSMLAAGLFWFMRREYPIPIRFQLITVEEKKLLRDLMRGWL